MHSLNSDQRSSRKTASRRCIFAVNENTARPIRAGDGIRTHDNNVGNVVLYQLSYARNFAKLDIGLPQQLTRFRCLKITQQRIERGRL